MRLTDEELSRVLTAHEAGGLERYGGSGVPAYPACLIQVAQKIYYCAGASLKYPAAAKWFDDNYQPSWTTDEFLAALEARGLA